MNATNEQEFSGKTIVITGGASGMGTPLLRAIVRGSRRRDAAYERTPDAVRYLFDVEIAGMPSA